jgi:poly-gamma-glutamate synthesis protein (capsule biosynthesis protein)
MSIIALTGLLVIAFDQQKNRNSVENVEPTPAPTKAPSKAATPIPSPTPSPTPTEPVSRTEPIILGFAGDVNLDADSYPVAKYDEEGKGILGVLSKDLVAEMNAADLMMLNNEFAYSTRGVEETDKSYTFRADPGRVGILNEMGVDIVSLANNHALDFGPEALLDTFSTLDTAKIAYVGAGENMARAKAPFYFNVGDKTIAFVAASRVVFAMDWYATDTTPGMIGTYDPTLFLESIKEAKENADFVVAYVHWGVERNNYPENYQKVFAKNYIDAGADAVIGCHPHVMQGLEFYKGKPIAYSLGNFWFNKSTKESGMIKLFLEPDDTIQVQLLPVMNKDTKTYILTKEKERSTYFNFMEGISFDVKIDDEGFVTEADK